MFRPNTTWLTYSVASLAACSCSGVRGSKRTISSPLNTRSRPGMAHSTVSITVRST